MGRFSAMRIICVRLPDALVVALDEYTKAVKTKRSAVIRAALLEYLKARGVNVDEIIKDYEKNPWRYGKAVVVL